MTTLLETTKIHNHIVPLERAAGAVEGAAIDTDGFDEAVFVVACGAIGAATTVAAKIQHSSNGTTGWDDIEGAAIVTLTATDDNKAPAIGLRLGGRAAGSRRRYLRAVLTVAGDNEADVGVLCLLSKARHAPVTNVPVAVDL